MTPWRHQEGVPRQAQQANKTGFKRREIRVEALDAHWWLHEFVHQHHERLDRSGYPRGLLGDQILPGAKVLAVADGPNDIELLANAAVRAVPEVAHASALELATTVIPAARDGGWAEVTALLD